MSCSMTELCDIVIAPAEGAADLSVARQLFTEYQEWLNVDLCFQDFQQELDTLPGKYAPPSGCLLLARDGGKFAGAVCLRPLENNVCEMKRLFVRPDWRGIGLGRMLAIQVIDIARKQGYEIMKLDTLARLVAAESLYESLGFVRTEAYCVNPEDDVTYMALDLSLEAGATIP